MGVLSGGCIEKDIGASTAYVYNIRIPKHGFIADIFEHVAVSKRANYFVHDGIMWTRVAEILEVDYSGPVYDLNIQDNHNYTTDMGLVHNSGRRNGSIAVYLEPWHADVEQFLEMKLPQGAEEERARDLFYALWVPDLFMKRVRENGVWSLMCPDQCKGLSDVWGERFEELYEGYERAGKFVKQVKAQEIWFKILQSQIESGVPYICYKDAANRKSNQQNLGTIKSSNLCVAGDTQILTDQGYVEIKSVAGQYVNVWNGEEFSEVEVMKTGAEQPLITVNCSNGMSVKCTPYHKFHIETSSTPSKQSIPEIIEAKDLKIGMRIVRFSFPTINTGTKEIKDPYTQGLFAAEGTFEKYDESERHRCSFKRKEGNFCKRHIGYRKMYDEDDDICCAQSNEDKPMLWLYGDKQQLLTHISWRYFNVNEECNRLDVAMHFDMQPKFFVPLGDYTLNTKIRWLEGYLDGDGTVIEQDGTKSIQVTSVEYEFLTQVVYLLNTLGVACHMKKVRDAGMYPMPDGNGGSKLYKCRAKYRVCIDGTNVYKLTKMGFSPKRLDLENIRLPVRENKRFITISGIVDNEENGDTYCFNEPKRHMGIFNGILIGNCSEVIEYSDSRESSVCNLSSICLPTYVKINKETNKPYYDFEKLHEVVKVSTKNLNKVIDINFYPHPKTRRSNLRHRPIGIGVQGLADTFVLMKMPFDSAEARELNRLIFETIYHAAVEQSMEIAKKRHLAIEAGAADYNLNWNEFERDLVGSKYPGAYSTFDGSPASLGRLQFDLWGVKPTQGRYEWDVLKADIMKYGMRNSLLLAPMPTASTSQIMGFNECFEPFTSNIYKRKTLAGEFILVNKYLIKDLAAVGLWNKEMKNKIIMADGSIQGITEIPHEIRDIYKIVWEIKQKVLIDMAADRGAYVCQSQSLNLFVEDPTYQKLSSMHFYSWGAGLKTGIYYLRTRPRAMAQKVTMEPVVTGGGVGKKVEEDEGGCVMCSA
jgi:ribonucleoside-diphosphate reductase alpha chain